MVLLKFNECISDITVLEAAHKSFDGLYLVPAELLEHGVKDQAYLILRLPIDRRPHFHNRHLQGPEQFLSVVDHVHSL